VFPHAVLLTDKLDARIADLGLATFVQDDGGSTRRTQTHTHGGGTRGYEAPEVANLKFSSKADMFSASVMFYEMATGKLPDMQSINSDTIFDPLKSDPQTLELLKFMLKINSAERPTAKDVISKISTLITVIEPMDEVDSGEALLGRGLTPVETKTLRQMKKLARDGVGENTSAHGGLAVVGDVSKLFERMPNGNPKFVKCKDPDNFDWTSKRFDVNDFKQFCIAGQQDGAMVIDQSTGKLCGCNYAIQDLRYAGEVGGGTRHSAGSSMAENPEAGKCFVIVLSENECASAKAPKHDAYVTVFNRSCEPHEVPVHAA